jgi:hypothetical protein
MLATPFDGDGVLCVLALYVAPRTAALPRFSIAMRSFTGA